jgi:hypothetical protein
MIQRLGRVFLLQFGSTGIERQGGATAGGGESSSLGYRALNMKRFLPERSVAASCPREEIRDSVDIDAGERNGPTAPLTEWMGLTAVRHRRGGGLVLGRWRSGHSELRLDGELLQNLHTR